jgi:nitrite reductase/ring-hydroxylating ferredoxin subunit
MQSARIAVCLLAAVSLAGCATISYRTQVPLTAPDAYTIEPDGSVAITLGLVPSLEAVGGAATIEDQRLPNHIIIVQPAADRYVAASSHCTHRKMALGYDHESQVFRCSALGKSEFGLDGVVLSGPASSPLEIYSTNLVGGTLVIRDVD